MSNLSFKTDKAESTLEKYEYYIDGLRHPKAVTPSDQGMHYTHQKRVRDMG